MSITNSNRKVEQVIRVSDKTELVLNGKTVVAIVSLTAAIVCSYLSVKYELSDLSKRIASIERKLNVEPSVETKHASLAQNE